MRVWWRCQWAAHRNNRTSWWVWWMSRCQETEMWSSFFLMQKITSMSQGLLFQNLTGKVLSFLPFTFLQKHITLRSMTDLVSYIRRKKVATALLKACEAISTLWGYEYLALRAYENDWGARALYENAGYRVVSGDAPWVALIGRRRRILMIKRCSSRKPPAH